MATERKTMLDGLVVGLIGFASVAALYGFMDILAGRGVFHTVNLLGQALFKGLRDPAVLALPILLDMTMIALYSGLHLALSMIIGLTVVGLIGQSERRPEQSRVILIVIVAGFAVTILAVGMLTEPIRPLLPWWSIVVANSLAVLLAGTYLLRKRADVWRRLILAP